jgi:glycerol-3-phosphate acyltransferase PlsY
MQYALIAIGSYLLGALPFGFIVARLCGTDITSVGSGNIGATNVARVLGWRLGLAVFFLDVGKGVVPPLATVALTGSQEASLLMGVAAVVGHTLSPFLRFRGGKGVATGLGALIGGAPLVGAAAFATFLVVFALTRIVSLSSLVAAASVLAFGLLTHQGWVFFAVYVPLVVYVFVRHSANIERLLRKQEPRLDLREKLKKESEVNGA